LQYVHWLWLHHMSFWPKIIYTTSITFLVGTISNVLVMEIGWTDVGSGDIS
jgi:hypothetical protein